MKLFGTVCDVLMVMALCLQERLYFVMEYMPGGTLGDVFESVEFLSEETARFYMAQISLAIGYLHKCGVVHR
jgi:serine/threonine protein kinase